MDHDSQVVRLSVLDVLMSRVTIKELRLRNYRAFADARLVLDDVTFLVGRNGAGKSTLMDAFSFVREAVTDSLGTAMERRGGFLELFPRDQRRSARQGISVAVCFQIEREHSVLYGFTVGWDPRRAGYLVRREVLQADRLPSFERDENGFRSPSASLQPALDRETLILPLIAGANARWKRIAEALRLISIHQISPQAMRDEPRIGREEQLSRDGGNAGDVLKRLKKLSENGRNPLVF